jgi:UPF0755 protein
MESRSHRSCLFTALILLFVGLLAATFFIAFVIVFPQNAIATFGEPDPSLPTLEQILYADRLFFARHNLISPINPAGSEVTFQVSLGESINAISLDLVNQGLIHDATSFRNYLIFSGLDKNIQAGEFKLNSSMDAIQIAHALLDATPSEIDFSILAGWRLEEIAASLPTSGLAFSPEEFLSLVRNPIQVNLPNDFPTVNTLEGYFLPGSYPLPRVSSAREMIQTIITSGWEQVTPDLKAAFQNNGLTVNQAVILASLIQREAMVATEMPQIASVFYNRLASGMKLDSDPTVQYALGYNPSLGSWWKSPLSLSDLQMPSPYNTYLNQQLPPGPICNPSITALEAVAFPAQTPYYYFRARCDGSGLHSFAITFEEHQNNACP